jgi:DNA-binding MarR family transcriptional regulator
VSPDARLDDATDALRDLIVAGERYRVLAARGLGLSALESQAISFLLAFGPAGQNALADVLNIGTGTTTALIDRLEGAGLVERHSHATDRRRNVVHLTELGTKTITELRSWLVDACADLPPETLEDTAVRLRAVSEALARRTEAG